MANQIIHHLLIKRRFKGTNRFLVPSSNNFQLAGPPHRSLHSNSCSSLDTNNGQSSSVVMYDYDKITNLNDVLEMFNGMINKRPVPSVVKFTQLLHHVTQLKQYSCSLDLFKQMCAFGFHVNKYTAGIAIKCYCRLRRTKHGHIVLGLCFKQGFEPHVSTYNTLFKGFIREHMTHEAEELFSHFIKKHRLCKPNLATYNTMVKGLCKVGNHYAAIGLLRLVDHGTLGGGCKFDVVTYNIIFDSLCKDVVGIDDVFKLLKEMVFHKAIPPNVHTYNSLIYNLSKLGRWDEVCRMLKQMEEANIHLEVKTFNIIVDTLCKQGKIDEAQVVINIMVGTGGKYPPDIVTYNSLIDAYCWRHDTSEARRIFDSLASKCIKPNTVTYNRLLLGYNMDFKPDEFLEFHDWLCEAGKADRLAGMFWSGQYWHHKVLEVGYPTKGSYMYVLKYAKYKYAAAFVRLMHGSELNLDADVYTILVDRAIKYRKFDQARRHYHDLLLKGISVDSKKHKAMAVSFCEAGLYREADKVYSKGECEKWDFFI